MLVVQVALVFDRWAAISQEHPSEVAHPAFVAHLHHVGLIQVIYPALEHNSSSAWYRFLHWYNQSRIRPFWPTCTTWVLFRVPCTRPGAPRRYSLMLFLAL